MPKREKQAHGDRALSFLHEFACDVVDCTDVIGIESMAQSEGVRERRRSQHDRIVVEGTQRPKPDSDVGRYQQNQDADYSSAQICSFTAENA